MDDSEQSSAVKASAADEAIKLASSDTGPSVAIAIPSSTAAPVSPDTEAPKKKGKKKKKKLTAKEKQLEKLEKLSQKLADNPEKFNEFIKFVAYWLKTYQNICHKMLNKQALLTNEINNMKKVVKNIVIEDDDDDNDNDDDDEDEEEETKADNLVSYDDFKLVLQDLQIPCTKVELHLLCKLLDPNLTGFVDYRKLLPDYLTVFLNHDFQDGIRFIQSTKTGENKASPQYPVFTFKLWKPLSNEVYPKYVLLDIKLATFASDKEYRGHFKDELLYSHLTIFSLIEMIKKKADIASNRISIFKDPSRHKSVKLEEGKTLEECGYKGGPHENPKEYVVFYDYTTVLRDDPIINSDFYFINNTKFTSNTKK